MRTAVKIAGGLAAAALAAMGTSALTGSGLSTSGSAAAPQFIGGSVTQSVTGATMTSVAYGFADTTNTAIHSAVLTFANADADTKAVTLVFTGGNAAAFTCTAIEATNHTSTCTADTADETGAASAAITVS